MKEKNYLLSKSFIIFLLKETVNEVLYCAVIFQEKTEMLKRHFFSEKLQADFSDIREAVYFSEMKSLLQISAENIQNFIIYRSEEHTSELQSHSDLVCRLLLEKKKKKKK